MKNVAGYHCWHTIKIFGQGSGGDKGVQFPEKIQGEVFKPYMLQEG